MRAQKLRRQVVQPLMCVHHHEVVVAQQFHQRRAGDVRVSVVGHRRVHVPVGGALQDQRRTCDAAQVEVIAAGSWALRADAEPGFLDANSRLSIRHSCALPFWAETSVGQFARKNDEEDKNSNADYQDSEANSENVLARPEGPIHLGHRLPQKS
jgi:hypothetical protein